MTLLVYRVGHDLPAPRSNHGQTTDTSVECSNAAFETAFITFHVGLFAVDLVVFSSSLYVVQTTDRTCLEVGLPAESAIQIAVTIVHCKGLVASVSWRRRGCLLNGEEDLLK